MPSSIISAAAKPKCQGQRALYADKSAALTAQKAANLALRKNHIAVPSRIVSRGGALRPVLDPRNVPVVETLTSNLNELKDRLVAITPRESPRWDQPLGRLGHLKDSHIRETLSTSHSSREDSRAVPKPLFSGKFHTVNNELPIEHWNKQIAPDGRPFFINYEGAVTFVTDTFLGRPGLAQDIEYWRASLLRLIHSLRQSQQCSAKYEVYLMVEEMGGPCYYYMIDYGSQRLCWAHEISGSDLNADHNVTDSELECLLEIDFWKHLELFPHSVPGNAEDNLRSMLLYANIDVATTPKSAAPYSQEECSRFLRDLDEMTNSPAEVAVRNHVIARLSKEFALSRYLVYFATERKHIDPSLQSTCGNEQAPSVIVRLVLWMLHLSVFGMDAPLLRKMEDAGFDDVVRTRLWTLVLSDSIRGTDQSNVVASIILVANISFLAVSNLSQLQASVSLVSTVLALSSLLIGLHLIRKHCNGKKQTAEVYQATASSSFRALRLFAFCHCLPSALLIWSILTFCVTICLLAYSILPDSVGLRIFMTTGIILLLLLAVTVGFFWQICEPAGEMKSHCGCGSVQGRRSDRKAVTYSTQSKRRVPLV